MTDEPKPIEDFSNFDIGSDITEGVELGVRRLLHDCFSHFLSEGRWGLYIPEDNKTQTHLTWEVAWGTGKAADGFWGDEFPVSISINPNDLLAAFQRDYFIYEEYELRRTISEWRAAIDAIENLYNERPPKDEP